MTPLAEAAPHLDAFRAHPGIEGEPGRLTLDRTEALRRFAELGYPSRRQEAWRFTNLRPLTAVPILPAPALAGGLDPERLAPLLAAGPTHRLVLVNGRLAPELSRIGVLPPGVWLGSTAEAARRRPDLLETAFGDSDASGAQPFASLNAAFYTDGFVLVLEPGAVLAEPVEIIHIADAERPGAFHLRNLVVAGAGSRATVIETASGTGDAWTNAVTSATVGADAVLRHVKIQNEAPEALHTSVIRAVVSAGGRYDSFTLTLGALLSRQDLHIALTGPGAALALRGAYLLRDAQEATFAPFVEHQAPDCRTEEVLKGVMADCAHGVFLGTIAVRPGADGTLARQTNRNLLLSPQAWVDTKPALEILADDVKCSHGATVGSLDEAALFYLQARGLDPATARHLLIEAFAAEVIDAADPGEVPRALLRRHLDAWLDERRISL
jgi:Fe-S cluster assembly protein SufD